MLKVVGLETWYGGIQALRGVSFHVKKGELLTIIGANGGGKSTLLNTITGLLKPKVGKILLEGIETQNCPAEDMVRKGLVLVPERRRIFPELSVHDNLLLGSYHRYSKNKREIPSEMEQIYNTFPILKKYFKRLAGNLSGGEQQMLAIGRGLMSKPKIILLDEPSLGLAPLVVNEIMAILASLKDLGVTVILVEQNARAALKVAERAYILERGLFVFEGTVSDLLNDGKMQTFYVGRGRKSG